jgi:type I restriction enzyme, S subunit
MNQDRTSTTTNSQLKEGYKQTEVGIIPQDWLVTALGDLGNFKNGINKNSEAFGHGHPFVNLMDVFGVSSISATNLSDLIETNSIERQTYNLKEGDVLFIRSSVKPSGVGLTALIEEDLDQIVYSGFLIRFRDNGSIGKNFKQHCFYEEGFRKRLISASSVSANTNINQDNLKQLLIPLPPTKAEQEAIACTLSDIDALIESLDRLLTKKRQIKQGAMQELLRSKDGWIERQLGDISHIQTGSRNNQDKVEDGEYPLFVRSATVERINTYSYDCEAILIPGEGGIGSIFHYINGRFDAHQRVYVIREFSEEISGKYVYLYMSKKFGFHAMQNSVKATVDSLRLPTFQNFQIFVPPTLEEQIEIANILSDMDAEIGSIESKLAKTCKIKQGMMHELLTGRIRLVDKLK